MYFWVQTTVKNRSGDYVRFQVHAPYATVDEFTEALVERCLIPCDKIFAIPDCAGRKVVTGRERLALGLEYVGMLQISDPQPYEAER